MSGLESIKSISNRGHKDDFCYYCNNEGRTKENPYECKHCGRKYNKLTPIQQTDTSFLIPQRYKDEPFDRDRFKAANIKATSEQMKRYYEAWFISMMNILDNARDKRYEPRTYYIQAQPRSGIRHWCYELISIVTSQGIKMSNITDINDIDLDNNINTDILEEKVAIFRLTNYKVSDSLMKLNYIIPKRESNDLITIITTVIPYNFAVKKIDYVSFPTPVLLEKEVY